MLSSPKPAATSVGRKPRPLSATTIRRHAGVLPELDAHDGRIGMASRVRERLLHDPQDLGLGARPDVDVRTVMRELGADGEPIRVVLHLAAEDIDERSRPRSFAHGRDRVARLGERRVDG